MKNLERIPVTEEELKGRKGKFKLQRRRSSKILSDIRFLMKHITTMVEEAGAMEVVVTPSSIDRMFAAVSHRLILSPTDDQNKWVSVAKQIRLNRALLAKDLQSSPAPKPVEN